MTTCLGDRADDRAANVRAQLLELLFVELAQVAGAGEARQKGQVVLRVRVTSEGRTRLRPCFMRARTPTGSPVACPKFYLSLIRRSLRARAIALGVLDVCH